MTGFARFWGTKFKPGVAFREIRDKIMIVFKNVFKDRRTIRGGKETSSAGSAPFSCPRKGGVPNDIEGKNRIFGWNSLSVHAETRIFDTGALRNPAPQAVDIEGDARKTRNCSRGRRAGDVR